MDADRYAMMSGRRFDRNTHANEGDDYRVLVATDCLSEGINLQDHFDAVMHYDLSWNPTRHEQREGRTDRYGQPSPLVRTVTYYGLDNQIDGVVLDVLLRKHKAIRTSLGISVPLPANTGEVIQALMNGLLLRGSRISAHQLALPFMNDMTVADLQNLDLVYAPPFAPVWDPILVAANQLIKKVS